MFTVMSQEAQHRKPNNISISKSKAKLTGWSILPSTTAFRALNFELFIRPNKYVMAAGGAIFICCLGYIGYMNYAEDKSQTKYVTLDKDGGITSRVSLSRWD